MLEKAEEFGCQREKASLPQGDVEVEIPNLDVRVGDNFDVTLQFKNSSDQRRTADVYITGTVVYIPESRAQRWCLKLPKSN